MQKCLAKVKRPGGKYIRKLPVPMGFTFIGKGGVELTVTTAEGLLSCFSGPLLENKNGKNAKNVSRIIRDKPSKNMYSVQQELTPRSYMISFPAFENRYNGV